METGTRATYKVGDKVWIMKEIRKKGDDRFEGPYEIIEQIHERSYRLKDENNKQIIRNVEKFKNFKNGGDVGSAVESIKFLKLQYYQIIN